MAEGTSFSGYIGGVLYDQETDSTGVLQTGVRCGIVGWAELGAFNLNDWYAADFLPDLNVKLDGDDIADGETTPQDFGAVTLGAASPQLTFTLQNVGDKVLTISSITVPGGFSIDTEPATVAVGVDEDLIIDLDTDTPGVFTGDITINSDDPDAAAYNFAITGTVLEDGGGRRGRTFGKIPRNIPKQLLGR